MVPSGVSVSKPEVQILKTDKAWRTLCGKSQLDRILLSIERALFSRGERKREIDLISQQSSQVLGTKN